MLSTQDIKIVVLVTLLVATFIFSMIPVKFMNLAQRQLDRDSRRRYKCILSFLSCFAAGVFLGTCLLDLFPEVQKTLTTALDQAGITTTFPMAEFILTFGFFIILIIEQLVLTSHGGGDQHSKYEPLLDSYDEGQDRHASRRLFSSGSETSEVTYGANNSLNTGSPTLVRYNLEHPEQPDRGQLEPVLSDVDSENEGDIQHAEQGGDGTEDLKAIEQSYSDPSSHSPIRSMILLLALSLHSIFEGLAIGLQPSASAVLQIFAPIALHKSILGFSLGLNLVQSKLSLRSTIKSNLLFCVTSPIGIGIGIAIIDLSPDTFVTSLVNGILQGFACGTFIYVVFFEILPHEFMTTSQFPNRLLKTLFMVLGYATISVLVLLEPDSVTTRHVCQKDIGTSN